MLKELRLTNFKNFRNATLPLGPFTVLVGANASGKSNIRDAFRFLHGIGRGYSVAEILGEKWAEGGALQWKGIRGGTREIAFFGEPRFSIEATYFIENNAKIKKFHHFIEIELNNSDNLLYIINEKLWLAGQDSSIFDACPKRDILFQTKPTRLRIALWDYIKPAQHIGMVASSGRPVLAQVVNYPAISEIALGILNALGSMKFLDLDPEAMRRPAIPGQTALTDRGENLSSVLHSICASYEQRAILLEWLNALTPMAIADFEFPVDLTGKILINLVEASGHKISAYSMSDSVLRFLGMLATLWGPEPAKFYFFEELENGIHPGRLSLLLQLIENRVYSSEYPPVQIVATTHSPQLLALLNHKSREHVSVVYRPEHLKDAKIKRVMEVPEAAAIIEKQGWDQLYESDWLENMLAFAESEFEEEKA
jgi:AAA15 family ATPase/GTPase